MKKNIFEKLKQQLPELQENVSLAEFTTFKIGGFARYFLIAKDKEALIKAIVLAKKNKLKIFILGGGSNLLVPDKGFEGLVIKLQASSFKLQDSNVIYSEAGVNLGTLIGFSAQHSLAGLDWGAGIPGTVGGAIFGNAQAFYKKISDNLVSVEYLDTKTFKLKKVSKKQCQFSLKNSIFKKNKNLVILSASFKLEHGSKEEIQKNILEHIKYRKNNHPINFPSAGSVFVNSEKKITNKKLLEKFPELKYFNTKGAIPSGYLIEKCGLIGRQIGGAKFSDIHANFIINTGGAKAKDVLKLMSIARQKVKKTFGINLETEIQYLK